VVVLLSKVQSLEELNKLGTKTKERINY
jgi:hypothetical protein